MQEEGITTTEQIEEPATKERVFTGRKAPNNEALLRRRREAVYWRSRGYTVETILHQLNSMAVKEGWGEITEKALYYDLQMHYDEIMGEWQTDPVKRLKNYKTQKNLQVRQVDQNIEEVRKIIMEDSALRRRGGKNPQQNAFLLRPLSPGQLSEFYKVLHLFMDMKNNLEGWGTQLDQKNTLSEVHESKENNNTIYDDFAFAAKSNPDLKDVASRIASAIQEVLPDGVSGQGSEVPNGVAEQPERVEGTEGVGQDVHRPSGIPGAA